MYNSTVFEQTNNNTDLVIVHHDTTKSTLETRKIVTFWLSLIKQKTYI